ncbi:coiled-coil domain-containing protein 186-like, partial [Saccostrea cucullata]|uniref:coiled-coil domain-containing protein 186-like n=1 Tax=Saccostrea cuccullata TaxID=36930 RepID=UPI002ED0DCB0
MSGIDPDEEANVTENPDPESESAASVNAENDLPESNPNDGVEGEINVPVSNEHLPQDNGSHPENVVDENVEENKAEEDGQGQDECVMNVEGDEKAEDEREADGGVIREGQISCGRDEQLIQGIGQEEAEADASLVREVSKCESESHVKCGASLDENESEPINVLEQSEQRVNDAREEENISEGSNSVINLGSDGSNSESNLVQCGVNNVVENLSPENSVVVDGNAVIPEDEICCQNWTSEARPQLHVLSPTESIESYEPECDQEADISPSHEPEPANSDEPEQANSSEMNETCGQGGGENQGEETICVVVNPQNPALSDKESRTDHVTSSQYDTKTTSCSTESNKIDGAGLNFVNVNGSVTNHIESRNKISTYESDDDLLSELESELTNGPRTNQNSRNGPDAEVNPKLPNGMCGTIDHKVRQEIQDLQMQLKHSRDKLEQKDAEMKRLTIKGEEQETYVERILKERDSYLKEIRHLKSQDDLYLPQIKELEYTIAQQTNEIRTVKDKLTSHDAAAKRTVAALQNELKVRVDQVTKMYEEANKEKDTMVVKYAMAEKKFIEGQKAIERLESKVRDLTKEKEGVTQRVKDIKGEKHRLMADLEAKAVEVQGLTKEVEKQSELISSSEVRIKWAQNKLRAELDAHKETKEELSKTRSKLKDAKDETEQIRRDCQAIIKTYQESEEIKSNKLDSELKMKESEFLQQQQEKTSQEEQYAATVKELASLKEKHQITLKEMESLKKK